MKVLFKERLLIFVVLFLGLAVCFVAYNDSSHSTMGVVYSVSASVSYDVSKPVITTTMSADVTRTENTQGGYVLPPDAVGNPSDKISSNSTPSDTSQNVPENKTAAPKTTKAQKNSQIVNINTANSETLQTLKGIGPAIAGRIIDYRETHGGFSNIEEVLNVSGIGEKRFADIQNFIIV